MCLKHEEKDAHEWHHDREHSHEPNESLIHVIQSGNNPHGPPHGHEYYFHNREHPNHDPSNLDSSK